MMVPTEGIPGNLAVRTIPVLVPIDVGSRLRCQNEEHDGAQIVDPQEFSAGGSTANNGDATG